MHSMDRAAFNDLTNRPKLGTNRVANGCSMLHSIPPTGPRGATSVRGTFAMRGHSAGGISKRGRGPRVRADKDGDLDMDGPARGGRGGLRGSVLRGGPRGGARGGARSAPRPHRNSPGTKLGLVDIRVGGWGSTDDQRESVIEFIEAKANVKVKKSKTQGKLLIISVPNAQVPSVLELDNSTHNGQYITITAPRYVDIDPKSTTDKTLRDAAPDRKTDETRQLLQNVFQSRFNKDARMLDLSFLGQDPALTSIGVFDTTSTSSKLFPALMVMAEMKLKEEKLDKKEYLQTVSLANNNLPSVNLVTTLSIHFPNIKNLSLQDNKITSWRDIDSWKYRFRDLEQLVLLGNPITSEPNYVQELARRYPKLIMLDNVVLDRAQIGLPPLPPPPTQSGPPKAAGVVQARHGESGSALPIKSSFMLDADGVGIKFLEAFFSNYDSNKDYVLSQYYDKDSAFTLSANTLAPRINQPGVSIPPKPWEVYYPFSRNLTRVHNAAVQSNKYFQGVEDIRRAWNNLPKTAHSLTIAEQWVYDIWPVDGLPVPNSQELVGGLILSVHGEFEEIEKVTAGKNSGLRRSFDRTFTIGPGSGPSGIRVVNDMLVVRPYGGFEAWKPTPEPANTQAGNIAPGMPTEPTPEVKQQMLNEVMRRTEMTEEYSMLCLTESGWNFEGALKAFENAKAGKLLPAEAFTRSGVV